MVQPLFKLWSTAYKLAVVQPLYELQYKLFKLFELSAAGDEEEDRRGLPTVPFARLAQSLQPPEGCCPSGGGQGGRGSHGHGVRPGCLLQAPRLHHPSLPREGAAPRETHLSLSVLPRPAGGRQAALQSAALGLHEEMLPGRWVSCLWLWVDLIGKAYKKMLKSLRTNSFVPWRSASSSSSSSNVGLRPQGP